MACRSFSGVVTAFKSYFCCRAATTTGERNGGRVGPSRMFRMPSASSAMRMHTAFCSNQHSTSERGRSLTPQPKASASANAMRMAL